jgi:hypothetical protein
MLLLQPGDPLPRLVLQPPVELQDFAGRYLLIVGSTAALPEVPSHVAVLHVTAQNDPHGITARRLTAADPGEFMAVLVDPAGWVVQSWGGPNQGPAILAILAELKR